MASFTEVLSLTPSLEPTVGMMDRVTQQNATMVEQASAAARLLADEADGLSRIVQRFRSGGRGPVAVAA